MNKILKNLIALPKRPIDSHKGTFGTLLIIAGSEGMSGAAVLAGKAALRTGVGLVKIACPEIIKDIINISIPECIVVPLKSSNGHLSSENIPTLIEEIQKVDGVVIGCGLTCNEDIFKIVDSVIRENIDIVIDADGLNVISNFVKDKAKYFQEILKTNKSNIIITPHPKEATRLWGDEIVNREEFAKNMSEKFGVTVVLKGANTVVVSKGENIYINETGNSGLAKGGTGDILAGMIGGFLTQKLPHAEIKGIYYHGLAADIGAEEFGEYSLLPTDVINNIHKAFLKTK